MTRMKFMMYCLLLFFLWIALPLSAQSVSVENVAFTEHDDLVLIRYDLFAPEGKLCRISLSLSDDKGETFRIKPVTINGDVGKNIRAGEARQIVWDLKADFPEGLSGVNFVFAVDAEIQSKSKWPYYLIGAGVIGGAALVLSQSDLINPKPKDGSISIEVPDEL